MSVALKCKEEEISDHPGRNQDKGYNNCAVEYFIPTRHTEAASVKAEYTGF